MNIKKKMAEKKFKPPEEWVKQAEYDLETAEAMFNSERYIYAVFMYHLSIEKALKGFYEKKFKKDPLKLHDLAYLIHKIELNLPHQYKDFLKILNELSVPTRYPNEIGKLLKEYKKEKTESLLTQTKELLKWLKEKL